MAIFADRLTALGTENAFKLGANIAECERLGRQVIKLNIGEPDFPTPEHICKEASLNLAKGNTHYCPPAGLDSFRQSIARQISQTRQIPVDFENIIVTTGGKPPIAFALLTYVNPGDEVIYPSPGFPIYESWIKFVGAVPVPLHLEEERDFRFGAADLAKLLTPKTKMIFICSPSNPTGGVLNRADLEDIARLIRDKGHPDLRIYSDEIYEQILFDGHRHQSIASFPGMLERTILVSGHSKSYAMTGWRLGYALLPSREEAQMFKNLNINTISCTPPFIQEAGRVALEAALSVQSVREMVTQFQARRDYAVPALNAISGISCACPQGAFYLFPNVDGACEQLGILDYYKRLTPTDQARTSPSKIFQMFLLYRHNVATLDRNSFGSVGVHNRHFIRLSIANSLENIKAGIAQIKNAVSDHEGLKSFLIEGRHFN